MHLPLLERAKEQSLTFAFTPQSQSPSAGAPHCSTSLDHTTARIPQRALELGEQYRFHFDMTKCIGCKCCVVACNEQNGNPERINWRRVGEIEGGWYPNTQRLHLSMGCNHCLEPTCLAGCPVDAYSKDPVTGVVIHSADTCIGCQYCTWNCSYGVPQYNPERGVVGKCDMRGGVTSAKELRRIADVAEKYNVPMVKVTGSQRVDLLGVKKADLPKIWADLGMGQERGRKHLSGGCQRTIRIC